MSAALLPCPFCGSSGEELGLFCDPDEAQDNSGPSRRVQCFVCHIEAPFYPTKAEAVAAWNRRVPATSDGADLEAAREERIREDERDVLWGYAGEEGREDIQTWLSKTCGLCMDPADRAALRRREDETGSNGGGK